MSFSASASLLTNMISDEYARSKVLAKEREADKINRLAGLGPRKKRNFKAVVRAVPDSSIVSETPRQVPGFNVSKHIAKPFLYGDAPKPKGLGDVPLKSLQEFSHVEGAALFNAPLTLIAAPLDVVIPKPSSIDWDALTEGVVMQFQPGFEYEKGIRPSIRRTKADAINEPAADPFRILGARPRPGARRVVTGTYDPGKIEIAQIGY